MKIKLLSLFLVLGLFALGTSAKAVNETSEKDHSKEGEPSSIFGTIAHTACEALGELSTHPCTKECAGHRDATSIGECIKNVTDESLKREIHSNVLLRRNCDASSVTADCYKLKCRKVVGLGGDTNCKAICCAAGHGDILKPCCDEAKDLTCCGQN